MTDFSIPRGLRNNNPGNISGSPSNLYYGADGVDYGGRFLTYPDAETGVSAMFSNLQDYQNKGLTTPAQIISRWAPPNENNTQQYINDVSARMGLNPNEPIDPNGPSGAALVKGMIQIENGRNPYSDQLIQQAQAKAASGANRTNATPRPLAGNVNPTSPTPPTQSAAQSSSRPPGTAQRGKASAPAQSDSNGCGGGTTAPQAASAAALSRGNGFAVPSAVPAAQNAMTATPPVARANSAIANAQLRASSSPGFNQLTPAALSRVLSVGAGILPGMAGTVPAMFNAALSSSGLIPNGSMISSLASHVNSIMGGGNLNGFLQTFSMAAGYVSTVNNIINVAKEAVTHSFGGINLPMNGSTTTLGPMPNSVVNNYNDHVTGGFSSLGTSLHGVAEDFKKVGKFGDLSDLNNLMTPGQIIGQLINMGFGDVTGITTAMQNQGLTVNELLEPSFQTTFKSMLQQVNDPGLISQIQITFNSNLNLTNMGDVTDVKIVLPNTTATSFEDLSIKLTSIGVDHIDNLNNLGQIMGNLEVVDDHPNIQAQSTALSTEHYDTIIGNLGLYGDTITVHDVIGSVNGYNITDSLNETAQALNLLSTQNVATPVISNLSVLDNLMAGLYSTNSSIIITDYAGASYPNLDAAAISVVDNVEYWMANLVANTDPIVSNLVMCVNSSYSMATIQYHNELTMLQRANINVAATTSTNNFADAVNFAQSLPSYATSTGIASPAEFLAKMTTSDVHGQAISTAMTEARNAAYLSKNGIDTSHLSFPKGAVTAGAEYPTFNSSKPGQSVPSTPPGAQQLASTIDSQIQNLGALVSQLSATPALSKTMSTLANQFGSSDFAIAASKVLAGSTPVLQAMPGLDKTAIGSIGAKIIETLKKVG